MKEMDCFIRHGGAGKGGSGRGRIQIYITTITITCAVTRHRQQAGRQGFPLLRLKGEGEPGDPSMYVVGKGNSIN